MPWNLSSGIGVPGSSSVFMAALMVVTLLSVGSIVATYAGHSRLRARLNGPYALLVLAVLSFSLIQAVRYGGTSVVAPGVGPGAWLGVAGAALAGQPVLTGIPKSDIDRRRPWMVGARIVGIASIVLAALSVGFNLYWQTHQALPGMGATAFGARSVALIVTAVVYDAAALAPIIIGSGWILQRNKGSRIATIVLGASTLAAGVLVWTTHVGREIDAFHGIAQNTSNYATVGFEGYLAWVIAAAIFAPLTLRAVLTQRPLDVIVWRQAVRKGLFLIAIWCAGSFAMRVVDLIDDVSFHLDRSIAGNAVLIAVELSTAALALWLRTNRAARSGLSWKFGILLVLVISRVVAGSSLAPRQVGSAALAAQEHPVYGNALAQQITSTFDVVLCFTTFGIAAMAVAIARTTARTGVSDAFSLVAPSSERLSQESNPDGRTSDSGSASAAPAPAATKRAPAAASGHASQPFVSASQGDDAREKAPPSGDSPPVKQTIDAVLQASTQRFAAGTTYTGRVAKEPDQVDE